MKKMRLFALVVGVGCVAGCAGFNDWRYGVSNECRARTAWHFTDDAKLRGHDFADGWKQGYFDVSMGRVGPPIVPPAKFLSPRFKGAKGAAAISQWYEGYQFGAIAAEKDGAGSQHRLPAYALAGQGGSGPGLWTPGTPGVQRGETLPQALELQELPPPETGSMQPTAAPARPRAANTPTPAGPMPQGSASFRPSAWHPPDLESASAAAYITPIGRP